MIAYNKYYYIVNKTNNDYCYIIKRISSRKYIDIYFIFNKSLPVKVIHYRKSSLKDINKHYNIIKEYNNLSEILIDFPELILY